MPVTVGSTHVLAGRGLPRRKGGGGVWEVEVSPGRWMKEAQAMAEGLLKANGGPVRSEPPGPVTRRQGPTAEQQAAWDLVVGQGMYQADAARQMGIEQSALIKRLAGHMKAEGIEGPVPGKMPPEELARRTKERADRARAARAQREAQAKAVGIVNGALQRAVDRIEAKAAAPAQLTELESWAWRMCHDEGRYWADAALERGTTPWAVQRAVTDAMRKMGVTGEPPGRIPSAELARRRAAARAADATATRSSEPRAGDTRSVNGARVPAGGSEDPTTDAPLAPDGGADQGTPVPDAEPATDPDPIPVPVAGDGATDPVPEIRWSDPGGDLSHRVVTTFELPAPDQRARYVDALLAHPSPGADIRDRIERALGIPGDADSRDLWAEGYRRALLDVLDHLATTTDEAWPQRRITDHIARLAIQPPMA